MKDPGHVRICLIVVLVDELMYGGVLSLHFPPHPHILLLLLLEILAGSEVIDGCRSTS